jgi:DNA-binding transcriptional ArsR family regulator
MGENSDRRTNRSRTEGDHEREDRRYRALANHERRRVLRYLVERGSATVEDLATLLVGWEATEDGETRRPAAHRRATVRLSHVHLPHLADAELVAYDREAGTVSPTVAERTVDLLDREPAARGV